MASFTDRIKLVFDVDKNAGTSALKSFKTDFAEAEGFSGKFKVAAGGAMDYAKDHALQLAAVGGAALAAFAVKALGAFEDLAKTAKDFGTATGETTEQASRWIAVADDMGVGAEQLQKSFEQIAKSMATNKRAWADNGIALTDARGQQRSTNDVMLDAFDVLAKLPEGSARAAAGNALFGRSYADLSPLIGKTRAEIEAQLAAVSKGQVITDKESETAERMRLAQDELHDAIQEVTLAVGQQAAKMAPLVEGLAKAIEKTTEWHDKLTDTSTVLGKIGTIAEGVLNPLGKAKDLFDIASGKSDRIGASLTASAKAMLGLKDATEPTVETVDDYNKKAKEAADLAARVAAATDPATRNLHGMGEAARLGNNAQEEWNKGVKAGQEVADAYSRSLGEIVDRGRDTIGPISDLEVAMAKLKHETDEADGAYQALMGHLDSEEAWSNAQGSIDRFMKVMGDSESTTQDQAQALRDAQRDLANFVAQTDTIPAEKKTEIYAEIRSGDLAAAKRTLDNLTAPRNVLITPVLKDVGKAGVGGVSARQGINAPNVTFVPDAAPAAEPASSATPTSTAGGIEWKDGKWQPVGLGEANDAAAQSAEDRERDELEQLRRQKERGDISLADYISKLKEKDDALIASGQKNTDLEWDVYQQLQSASGEAAAKVEADEKAKQDAIDATNQKLKEQQEAQNDAAQAQADLAAAADKQKRAVDTLADTIRRALGSDKKDAEVAQGQLGSAVSDAVSSTFAGAQARAAANGLTPGTPEYSAYLRQQIDDYITQHPELGPGFAAGLQQQELTVPTAQQYAAQPLNVTLNIDGAVLARVLTTYQQERQRGAT